MRGATSGTHAEDPAGGLWGQSTRGERTVNMACMSVTLDVSKATGWLKAAAYCRVESRACDTGARCVRIGRRGS